jgi:hypothetical protein
MLTKGTKVQTKTGTGVVQSDEYTAADGKNRVWVTIDGATRNTIRRYMASNVTAVEVPELADNEPAAEDLISDDKGNALDRVTGAFYPVSEPYAYLTGANLPTMAGATVKLSGAYKGITAKILFTVVGPTGTRHFVEIMRKGLDLAPRTIGFDRSAFQLA